MTMPGTHGAPQVRCAVASRPSALTRGRAALLSWPSPLHGGMSGGIRFSAPRSKPCEKSRISTTRSPTQEPSCYPKTSEKVPESAEIVLKSATYAPVSSHDHASTAWYGGIRLGATGAASNCCPQTPLRLKSEMRGPGEKARKIFDGRWVLSRGRFERLALVAVEVPHRWHGEAAFAWCVSGYHARAYA